MVPDREQAGADFAVAGDADAAAVSTERMRDRGDDADFADAVVEAVAARGFRTRMRDFDQRAVLGHARQNFVERDHCVRRPGAAFFERHEFDEAHGHAFFAREHAERDDLIFVEAAHQHAVHLQRPQPGAACGANAGEHVIVSVRHARDAGEAVGIDGVHRDGDAGQARVFQRLRQIGEQMAERIKIAIGSAATQGDNEPVMDVKGRDMISGLPRKTSITSEEIREALQEPITQIIEAVTRTLELAEPELAADLVDNGITMAGGSSLLRGLTTVISNATGLEVRLAEDPLTCVARGTAVWIENLDLWKDTMESDKDDV